MIWEPVKIGELQAASNHAKVRAEPQRQRATPVCHANGHTAAYSRARVRVQNEINAGRQ
jgi:hypothetical protein